MPEKEKAILNKFKKVIPDLSEGSKRYLLGVADGISLMSEHQAEKKEPVHVGSSTASR